MASSSPSFTPSSSIPLPDIANLTEQDAIHQIEAEIARFENHIRALRELRNTVIPISRFPAELLSKIISQCNEEDSRTSRLGYHTRLMISWVSRRWRYMALGDPSLWSCIRIYHGKWATPPSMVEYIRECFIRSKNLPLAVSYHGPTSQALAFCNSEIQRIQKLSIDLVYACKDSDNIWLPLPDEWRRPAPLLVNLKLVGVILEDSLFGGVSRPLAFRGSVTLKTCRNTWNWSFRRLSTITNLTLWASTRLVTPEPVAFLLRALPTLKTCRLERIFPETTNLLQITGPQVHLPTLRHLCVTDRNENAIAELLQRLDLPNASIELNDDYSPRPISAAIFDQNFERLKEYKASSWTDVRDIVIRDNILENRKHRFTITIHSYNRPQQFTVQALCGFDPVVRASQYLHLDGVRNMVLDQVSVSAVSSFGQLPSLESLEIENMYRDFLLWDKAFWKKIFPSVTRLKVEGISYPSFEAFLRGCTHV